MQLEADPLSSVRGLAVHGLRMHVGAVPKTCSLKPPIQVMEEIIAKSRMYRAIKAKQREEDEAALEAINQEFKELVRSAALKRLIKAPREDK